MVPLRIPPCEIITERDFGGETVYKLINSRNILRDYQKQKGKKFESSSHTKIDDKGDSDSITRNTILKKYNGFFYNVSQTINDFDEKRNKFSDMIENDFFDEVFDKEKSQRIIFKFGLLEAPFNPAQYPCTLHEIMYMYPICVEKYKDFLSNDNIWDIQNLKNLLVKILEKIQKDVEHFIMEIRLGHNPQIYMRTNEKFPDGLGYNSEEKNHIDEYMIELNTFQFRVISMIRVLLLKEIDIRDYYNEEGYTFESQICEWFEKYKESFKDEVIDSMKYFLKDQRYAEIDKSPRKKERSNIKRYWTQRRTDIRKYLAYQEKNFGKLEKTEIGMIKFLFKILNEYIYIIEKNELRWCQLSTISESVSESEIEIRTFIKKF